MNWIKESKYRKFNCFRPESFFSYIQILSFVCNEPRTTRTEQLIESYAEIIFQLYCICDTRGRRCFYRCSLIPIKNEIAEILYHHEKVLSRETKRWRNNSKMSFLFLFFSPAKCKTDRNRSWYTTLLFEEM